MRAQSGGPHFPSVIAHLSPLEWRSPNPAPQTNTGPWPVRNGTHRRGAAGQGRSVCGHSPAPAPPPQLRLGSPGASFSQVRRPLAPERLGTAALRCARPDFAGFLVGLAGASTSRLRRAPAWLLRGQLPSASRRQPVLPPPARPVRSRPHFLSGSLPRGTGCHASSEESNSRAAHTAPGRA